MPLALKDPKHEALDSMLTHYRDVQETLYAGQLGDGTGVTLTPDVWRRSGYPLLERLLAALRGEFEAVETWPPYWHIKEWYFRSRRVRKAVVRVDKRGRQMQAMVQGVPQFALVARRYEGLPSEVEAQGEGQVTRGIVWIGEAWPSNARFQPERVEAIVKRIGKKAA